MPPDARLRRRERSPGRKAKGLKRSKVVPGPAPAHVSSLRRARQGPGKGERHVRRKAAVMLQRWWRLYSPKGWSRRLLVRAINAAHARKRRQGRLRDLLLYCFFILVFQLASLAEIGDQDLFHLCHNVRGRLAAPFNEVDAPTRRRTFEDISTVAHWEQWLQGPLMDALYGPESFDGDATWRSNPQRNMLGYNKLVGSVAINQIRVRARHCDLPSGWALGGAGSGNATAAGAAPDCYGDDAGDYGASYETREPFGSASEPFLWAGWNGTDTQQRRTLPFTYVRTRFNTVLPVGGYTVLLPRSDRASAEALADHLVRHNYFDLQTRAVTVEATFLNPMLNRLVVVRLAAEVPKGGGVLTSYIFTAPSPHVPLTAPDASVRAFVVLEILFYGFFIHKELLRGRQLGVLNYFRQLDKVFHSLNLFFYLVVWALRFCALAWLPGDIDVQGDGFVDFVSFSEFQQLALMTNACNAFLCWFKFVTYLSMSPRFGILTDTLILSASAVGGFMVIFAIVTYGYALAYLMSFGSDLSGYRNVTSTLFTLLMALLGQFDMDSLIDTHWVMGPVMFVAFIGVGVFVILNMLIAIISSSYEVALEAQLHKDSFSFAEDTYAYVITLPWIGPVAKRLYQTSARVADNLERLEHLNINLGDVQAVAARRHSVTAADLQAAARKQALGCSAAVESLGRYVSKTCGIRPQHDFRSVQVAVAFTDEDLEQERRDAWAKKVAKAQWLRRRSRAAQAAEKYTDHEDDDPDPDAPNAEEGVEEDGAASRPTALAPGHRRTFVTRPGGGLPGVGSGSGGGGYTAADEAADAALEKLLVLLASKHRAAETLLNEIELQANSLGGGSFRFTSSSMWQLPTHLALTLDDDGMHAPVVTDGVAGSIDTLEGLDELLGLDPAAPFSDELDGFADPVDTIESLSASLPDGLDV